MRLMQRLQHVNYNFLYSTMEKPYRTGLRLKNSLSNQLVHLLLLRKSFNRVKAKQSDGTLADPLSTLTVIWATPGSFRVTQELHLQRHDSKSVAGLFRLQCACKGSLI